MHACRCRLAGRHLAAVPTLLTTRPPPRPPLAPPVVQQHEKVRWEEQRKSMQQDSQQKAQLAQYQVWRAGRRRPGMRVQGGGRVQERVAGGTACGQRAHVPTVPPRLGRCQSSEPNHVALRCREHLLQDELARKRMETEHEKNRQRNMELVALQVGRSGARGAGGGGGCGGEQGAGACPTGTRQACTAVVAWRCRSALPCLAGTPLAQPRVLLLAPVRVPLQEESGKRAEAEKAAIAAQIEAERRATEKYKAQVLLQYQ